MAKDTGKKDILGKTIYEDSIVYQYLPITEKEYSTYKLNLYGTIVKKEDRYVMRVIQKGSVIDFSFPLKCIVLDHSTPHNYMELTPYKKIEV